MFLEKINSPADLKTLEIDELKTLAEEMRAYLLEVLSEHPGHFAPNFGTIELAIALHTIYDTPRDKLIWDIGHQAYPHKLLTGRREAFPTIRQSGGISGFLSRAESEYDVFGAGHSSTSIAAALGIATARDLINETYKVVAIIGDGGLTGGMAFEALNAAGDFRNDMLVILNDNNMSISATVGAFSKHFHKVTSSPQYNFLRSRAKEFMNLISEDAKQIARKIEASLKLGTLFEEFGFRYFGPLDGNDLEALIPVLTGIRNLTGPILLHVVTEKGRGYAPAEADPVGFYSVSGPFNLETGKTTKPKPATPSYTEVFSQTLIELAKRDTRIVGVTAAMPGGTGLDKFAEVFPSRCFDIGLAEQCAVTFAGGLAAQGMRPVAAIYSTFLQRSYDQVLHDVCIQNLPVIFALDRAGLVGADGPTHHGVFDLAYLRSLPNMVVMAPKDEDELQSMVKTSLVYEGGPIAFRYPRGTGVGVKMALELQPLPIGKSEIIREGEDVLVIAIGNRVYPALEAAQTLADSGISATVINARFVKPLDTETIVPLAESIGKVITVEDGVVMGGFGSAVLEALAAADVTNVQVTNLGIPDEFIEHGDVQHLYALCQCDANGIARAAKMMAG
ncbi:MAG: 1-deoxy-D-xylulose-5-phosphate synthase [Candidatus Poribacteria bacterium]|nr:1-deoxy-D-xylulose-5-phosphate synthase [Candidatus Poribacteria bacterium]MYK17044.1 1-deoxy-D-xylulose-5-phosphate synthase [Candidatus Poribacteria bacterium]